MFKMWAVLPTAQRGKKMLIGNRYRVESDALNITLYQKGISKTNGNTYWRPIAYFSTVENALVHLVDLELAGTGLVDLKTVTKKQTELYRLVSELGNSPEVLQRVRSAVK